MHCTLQFSDYCLLHVGLEHLQQHVQGLCCKLVPVLMLGCGVQNINLGVFGSEVAAAQAYDAAAQQHGVQTGPVNFPEEGVLAGTSRGVVGSPGRSPRSPRGGSRGSRGRGRGRGRGLLGRARLSALQVCRSPPCSWT